jgi:hypothetical protein
MRGSRISLALIATIALSHVGSPPTQATPTWTKIYETVTSSRTNNSATSEMTYTSGFGKTGGAASSFVTAGTSWDQIKIRMELTRIVDNQTYYAEVSFDKWAGVRKLALSL